MCYSQDLNRAELCGTDFVSNLEEVDLNVSLCYLEFEEENLNLSLCCREFG